MGLLRRTHDDGTPFRLPGYAAMAREDMGDAQRRRPDVDLSGYAAERGLDFLASLNPAGYFGAVPLDPQLQFNVVRGVLDGRRDGCLFHWVRAWPTSAGGDPGTGTFYGKVWNPPLEKGWWKPGLSDVPYLGILFEGKEVAYDCAIGIPFTVAATNVPEAAMLPDFAIDDHQRPLMVGGHREKLGERGIPGFSLVSDVEPPPAVVDRLLAGPLRDVLAAGAASSARFELKLLHGTLSVRRNGYVKDPAGLDELVRMTCTAGDALRDACLPELAPQPFAQPLPGVDWPPSGVSLSGRFPPSPWLESLHGLSAQLGMGLEDPAAFHRAFGSIPVPGRPFAILRGTLPGTHFVGRLAFYAERPVEVRNDGRTALLLPAAPGAAETPPWGVRLSEPRLAYAVRDGVYAAWVLRSSGQRGDLGDVPGLLTLALRHGVEQGLVEAAPG